jgi:hypothetical protein
MLLELIAMDLEAEANLHRVRSPVCHSHSRVAGAIQKLERLAMEVRQLIGSPLESTIRNVFQEVCQIDGLEEALDLENDYLQSAGFSHDPLCGAEYLQRVLQIYKDMLRENERAQTKKPSGNVSVSINIAPEAFNEQVIRRLKALRRTKRLSEP